MKVAITSTGTTPQQRVDPRFGRARQFIIMDTESGEYQSVDNIQNFNAPQGAGVQAAQNVVDRGVEAVVTGDCGPKAFRVLSAANVQIFSGVDGTVEEAFEQFKKGELKQAASAGDGGW
jgi:predicted Fe-Mo cluster-binding NifX family protein